MKFYYVTVAKLRQNLRMGSKSNIRLKVRKFFLKLQHRHYFIRQKVLAVNSKCSSCDHTFPTGTHFYKRFLCRDRGVDKRLKFLNKKNRLPTKFKLIKRGDLY